MADRAGRFVGRPMAPWSIGRDAGQVARSVMAVSCAAVVLRALLLLGLTVLSVPRPCAASGCGAPAALVENGGYALAGTGLRCRADEQFVPASILKLATALAVLHRLGPDYRCRTRFVLDERNILLLEGFGDPLLTSEELALALRELRRRGVTRIDGLVLDDRRFALEEATPGATATLNPYDAANGALAVNFNTLPVLVRPDGGIGSAEEQTPTLPLMRRLAVHLPPGRHRVNISAAVLGAEQDAALQHVGELVHALAGTAGIVSTGVNRRTEQIGPARIDYLHESSRSLREVVRDCLTYSSNYTANQLLLILGMERYGSPATWDKGRRALRESLAEILEPEALAAMVLQDGAGLSRANRLTPASMLAVLEALRPHADLLPRLGNDLVKSGSMQGVFCYAGYLAPDQRAFVLMLNQRGNSRDRLLDYLRRAARASEIRR